MRAVQKPGAVQATDFALGAVQAENLLDLLQRLEGAVECRFRDGGISVADGQRNLRSQGPRLALHATPFLGKKPPADASQRSCANADTYEPATIHVRFPPCPHRAGGSSDLSPFPFMTSPEFLLFTPFGQRKISGL